MGNLKQIGNEAIWHTCSSHSINLSGPPGLRGREKRESEKQREDQKCLESLVAQILKGLTHRRLGAFFIGHTENVVVHHMQCRQLRFVCIVGVHFGLKGKKIT